MTFNILAAFFCVFGTALLSASPPQDVSLVPEKEDPGQAAARRRLPNGMIIRLSANADEDEERTPDSSGPQNRSSVIHENDPDTNPDALLNMLQALPKRRRIQLYQEIQEQQQAQANDEDIWRQITQDVPQSVIDTIGDTLKRHAIQSALSAHNAQKTVLQALRAKRERLSNTSDLFATEFKALEMMEQAYQEAGLPRVKAAQNAQLVRQSFKEAERKALDAAITFFTDLPDAVVRLLSLALFSQATFMTSTIDVGAFSCLKLTELPNLQNISHQEWARAKNTLDILEHSYVDTRENQASGPILFKDALDTAQFLEGLRHLTQNQLLPYTRSQDLRTLSKFLTDCTNLPAKELSRMLRSSAQQQLSRKSKPWMLSTLDQAADNAIFPSGYIAPAVWEKAKQNLADTYEGLLKIVYHGDPDPLVQDHITPKSALHFLGL